MATSSVHWLHGEPKKSTKRMGTARHAAANVLFWAQSPATRRRTSWRGGQGVTSVFFGGRRRRRTDLETEIVYVPVKRVRRTVHKRGRS
jgi:hypothetical protein